MTRTIDDVQDNEPADRIDQDIIKRMIMGVDVTEVYSPARVTEACKKLGLSAGSFFDLSNGWNFDKHIDRRKAFEQIQREQPKLLIGSPPCTYFSALQRTWMWHDTRMIHIGCNGLNRSTPRLSDT